MTKTNEPTLIERLSQFPQHLDHEDYNKCGSCLKQVIQHQIAQEFVLQGKINDSFLPELWNEAQKRFHESSLYKQIMELKDKHGLNKAIEIMESKGYIP